MQELKRKAGKSELPHKADSFHLGPHLIAVRTEPLGLAAVAAAAAAMAAAAVAAGVRARGMRGVRVVRVVAVVQVVARDGRLPRSFRLAGGGAEVVLVPYALDLACEGREVSGFDSGRSS